MSCRGFVPTVAECAPAMLSRPSGREDVKDGVSSSTTAAKNTKRTARCQCRNYSHWLKLNSEIESINVHSLFYYILEIANYYTVFKGTDPVFYKSKHNKDSRLND